MAFCEFETKRFERIVLKFIEKRRPPPHLRDQVDLAFRIHGQSIEIYEIRPWWNDKTRKIEEAIAKATYVKTQRIWRVYWQRADLKWHRYEPAPEVDTVEQFLALVDADDYCCFFG